MPEEQDDILGEDFFDDEVEEGEPSYEDDDEGIGSSEEEEQSKDDSSPVVTEELAEQFPVLKAYVGKPMTEIAKAYQSLQSDYTRKAQKLKEIEKQQGKPQKDFAKMVESLPDPTFDFDAWKEGFKKIVSEMHGSKEEELEQIRISVNEQKLEKARRQVLQMFSEVLPENTSVEHILASYKQERGDAGMKYLESLANTDLKLFVSAVTDYYNALQVRDEKRAASFDVTNQVRKQLKDVTVKSKPRTQGVSPRNSMPNKLSPAMQEILMRNLPQE